MCFRAFPIADYSVSNLFFEEAICSPLVDGKRCGIFPLLYENFWRSVREVGLQLPRIMMFLICGWLAWLLMFQPQKNVRDLKLPIAGIVAAIIGPALVTNSILKEVWGRPRPFHTVEFGGDQPFVLPGTITNYCETNCSFVSGEATAAFWMLIFGFFVMGYKRIVAFGFFGIVAIAIAMLRVIFGRHYFSDITMSFFVAISSILFAFWLLETRVVNRWIENLWVYSNRTAFRQNHKIDSD